MSAGAVTLQCPSCGGVFLTLQQSGALEICPHCAVSSPRSNYIKTNVPFGSHTRTELPDRREAASVVPPDVFFPISHAKSGHHVDQKIPAPATTAPSQAELTSPPVSAGSDPAGTEPLQEFPAAGENLPLHEAYADPTPIKAGLPLEIEPQLTGSEPAGSRRRIGWFTLLLLIAILGTSAWLVIKNPGAVSIPRPSVAQPPTAVAQTPAETQLHAPVKPDPISREETVLRARTDEMHMASLVGELVKSMDEAKTIDERLQFVDEPENHRADLERFFASNGGKLAAVHLEPSVGTVIVLPSGEEEKLFKLTTVKCPDGAIVRVIQKNNKPVLLWPLFEQSHDHLYDRFVKEGGGPDAPSIWFTVLCRLTQPFDLKGPNKDNWICLEAQGSLAPGGTGQVYAAKDTPAGRLLQAKMSWGHVYLTDLLLGRMELDGKQVQVVLDCAGTQPAGRPVH